MACKDCKDCNCKKPNESKPTKGMKPELMPKDYPEKLCEGWETRFLIATWYSKNYAHYIERLQKSIDKFLPFVRFHAFEFEPRIEEYHAVAMQRPLVYQDALEFIDDEYPDVETVLFTDADSFFARTPTDEELRRLIGFEDEDRFATTMHGPIQKTPCPGTMLIRGYYAFEFVRAWAARVADMWDEYCADTNSKGYFKCNGSMLEAKSFERWRAQPMFDWTLSRNWKSPHAKPQKDEESGHEWDPILVHLIAEHGPNEGHGFEPDTIVEPSR